ncbi:hypothetical protein AKO1_002800 [Acrasis kona]|uniref:F-box domain-containing protein n=1 Tax=Acrasis kona TaxID=1008807 RepID=A0AAW2YL55_9EUKA
MFEDIPDDAMIIIFRYLGQKEVLRTMTFISRNIYRITRKSIAVESLILRSRNVNNDTACRMISGYPSLKNIGFINTSITIATLKRLAKLRGNRILRIQISDNKLLRLNEVVLRKLLLQNSQLTTLVLDKVTIDFESSDTITTIIAEHLPNIKHLTLSNWTTELDVAPLMHCKSLESLSLLKSSHRLLCAVLKNTSIKTLSVDKFFIKDMDFPLSTTLSCLRIDYLFESYMQAFPNLLHVTARSLRCTFCNNTLESVQIRNDQFTDIVVDNIKHLQASSRIRSCVRLSINPNVESIKLTNMFVDCDSVRNWVLSFEKLGTLNLSSVGIDSSMDLSSHCSLHSLTLHNCGLTHFKLTTTSPLTYLNLSKNKRLRCVTVVQQLPLLSTLVLKSVDYLESISFLPDQSQGEGALRLVAVAPSLDVNKLLGNIENCEIVKVESRKSGFLGKYRRRFQGRYDDRFLDDDWNF